jgi:hypothetical protein
VISLLEERDRRMARSGDAQADETGVSDFGPLLEQKFLASSSRREMLPSFQRPLIPNGRCLPSQTSPKCRAGIWSWCRRFGRELMKAKPKPRKAEKPKDGKLKLGCRNGQAKIGHD